MAILEDKEDRMWFGTEAGVSRFDGTTWRTYTVADGLGRDCTYVIFQDSTGALWFGHWDGRDSGGSIVEDGVYLVTVEALGKKMVKPLGVVR